MNITLKIRRCCPVFINKFTDFVTNEYFVFVIHLNWSTDNRLAYMRLGQIVSLSHTHTPTGIHTDVFYFHCLLSFSQPLPLLSLAHAHTLATHPNTLAASSMKQQYMARSVDVSCICMYPLRSAEQIIVVVLWYSMLFEFDSDNNNGTERNQEKRK